jgi:CubicO group peptidase (beta-lactamase class C family)
MNGTRFDSISRALAAGRLTRRTALAGGTAAIAAGVLGNQRNAAAAQDAATPVAGEGSDPAADIVGIARDAMERYNLRAVILRVTIDGKEIVTTALGESMSGVPAATDMHFRNGAVAIAYVATVLLRLVDQGKVGLDDPISTWLPELPESDRVTLRMLVNMTSGYNDHVKNQQFVAGLIADPFRQWTPQELIELGLGTPRTFAPGTNWDYSHAGYVILGKALEKIAGKPLDVLLQEEVLAPLGLRNTASWATPFIPEPVLHAFTAERKEALGIPEGTRFMEETTYWNPSWTISEGAVQTTDIYDMAASAVAIGEGTLLSPESHAAQVAPDLIGFGAPLEGCKTCHTLDEAYNYGLGVKRWNEWLVQDPTLAGYDEVMAYLPAGKIAIALAATYREEAFVADAQGNYTYSLGANALFTAIGTYLAPDFAPPKR